MFDEYLNKCLKYLKADTQGSLDLIGMTAEQLQNPSLTRQNGDMVGNLFQVR